MITICNNRRLPALILIVGGILTLAASVVLCTLSSTGVYKPDNSVLFFARMSKIALVTFAMILLIRKVDEHDPFAKPAIRYQIGLMVGMSILNLLGIFALERDLLTPLYILWIGHRYPRPQRLLLGA
jgi:hypothetical protein